MELYEHQKKALKCTKGKNKCAYYLDMGLGKTVTSLEKANELGNPVILVICQKSLIGQWVDQIRVSCTDYEIVDGTKVRDMNEIPRGKVAIVINYDLTFRRKWINDLCNFTMILDESSMIQNPTAKRTKAIMKLNASATILLSGTPVSGKYENLWTQCKLLGWNITKKEFYARYIVTVTLDIGGFPIEKVVGYKNVDELKQRLREYGAVFMKTDDVLTLPSQTNTTIKVKSTPQYKRFMKHSIVEIDGDELVGDNSLTKLLYARQLCGQYNKDKLNAFGDLVENTGDRLIVFYNFTAELDKLLEIAKKHDRKVSIINGNMRDLTNYESVEDSITFIQYQAGAMGLNLQKANKIIYYTLPLSSELFEQSKKRTHRIGQPRPCFYYHLVCDNSIEEKIIETLAKRKDYTDALFKEDYA